MSFSLCIAGRLASITIVPASKRQRPSGSVEFEKDIPCLHYYQSVSSFYHAPSFYATQFRWRDWGREPAVHPQSSIINHESSIQRSAARFKLCSNLAALSSAGSWFLSGQSRGRAYESMEPSSTRSISRMVAGRPKINTTTWPPK